ncbi:ABC transporter ATP-binding protein [Roseibacillus ishigakijimensis]|uniref:ATP-binding cassette domain-containing protein n=1 Tax=Roseibacillus ishigakijimensis TaxID=454146 RepID=A0A934RNQ6_9BACT|nr:ATP-binding cassette domain-containing protein [Roseibacillus ishigakijimensis]MBK1834175.1 ATP-binding cassette domain-containing protein [Roseibacillus ishigakijimensis]
MIAVENLTKSYGRHTAVDAISFEVNEGDVVGFLGPNGAGKTSTIRVLTGYHPPTSGAASVAGYDIFRQSIEARRQIGYMPENVPLYREMRVREFLKHRGTLKGLRGKELQKRLDIVIEECGLGDVRRKMIKTLSKGYRQRVGLADALVHDPPLLILDEPTNGLDPNQIRSIRNLIKNLAADRTIFLSSHILSEVEMICKKVIILEGGHIKANDTPANLVKNMRAAGHISLEIQAPREALLAAIGELPHIKKTSVLESSDDGWHKLSILVDSNTETRPRLSKMAEDQKWPLRTLYRHEGTLEDVFVELTRKD